MTVTADAGCWSAASRSCRCCQGPPQQATHDYARHGTANLYAALEVASAKVISQLTARHPALEFKRSLDHINQQVSAGLDVHVICDNSSTYKKPAIERWLLGHPRFHLHFTRPPAHG